MDILNSNWLIKMLEKSSQTPHGRLLSLFDILEDWLDAPQIVTPNIRGQIGEQFSKPTHARLLQDYLTIEAAKAGAAMPEVLANQLYFMAVSATQERLQANIHEVSGHATFNHAKSAAKALILAQTKKEFHIAKSSAYAIAASFLGVLVVAGTLYINQNMSQSAEKKLAFSSAMPIQAAIPQLVSSESMADPQQTAALMAQIELMRHGNCQLIEAIQLPDQYKGIYLNMVVNGQVSTDPREQKIAFALLKQTRCNYTPMLMANSK
jgi:hypothetical protein